MNTVYIVDDDQIVLDYLIRKRGLFSECGFEICGVATNPIKALEEIKEKRPNVVLSDLKMPGLSGIQLFEALRGEVFKPLFVIISAYSDFTDIRRFFVLNDGFDYLLKPISDHDLAELLNRLAAKINQEPVLAGTETRSRELNEILRYLREYPAMNHTLETIGERCSINPNTVCNLFAKHLNTTFLSYLTTLRMEQAKELLRTTDMPVKEVGIRSGYTNYFYFTRIFDKTYGQTPSAYRRELHG